MGLETSLLLGLTLVSIGGFVDSSVGVFLKYPRRWKWEHLWLTYNLLGFGVFPWVVGFVAVSNLTGILGAAELLDVGRIFLFGLGWGLGAVLFGLSVKYAGVALSYAIVMGLTSAIGALVPLVLWHSEDVFTLRGGIVIGAVLVLVLGVILCSWAGHFKEIAWSAADNRGSSPIGQRPMLGVALAILSGIFSPMSALGFNYGGETIELLAKNMGTPALWASVPVAVILLNAGAAVNVAYCGVLISRAGTWNLMQRPSTDHVLGLCMALIAPVGLTLFPMGSSQMGDLGKIVGWPIMASVGILGANSLGALTGEWKGAGKRPVILMMVAAAILSAAMFALGGLDEFVPFVRRFLGAS